MGRGIIQHPETKKYAIWSSVVDDFITDWLDEEELKQWQINDYAEQIKEQPIKVSRFLTFDECLHTIETYQGKDRVDEVKDGGSNKETCAFSNENEIEEAHQYYMGKTLGKEISDES